MIGGDFDYAPSQTYTDTTVDTPPAINKIGLPGFLTTGYSTGNGTISPAVWLLGLFGVLVALKIIGELKSTGIQPAHVHISVWNILVIGLISSLSIVSTKILLNSVQVPGLTDLVNAA